MNQFSTGESLPSRKIVDVLDAGTIPIAERKNMVFAGTRITGGQGIAVVVAVGASTEVGKVQTLVSEAEQPTTPIEKQLTVVGNQLTAVSGVVCVVIFFIGLLRGSGLIQMLKVAVSLAVAALPEGLPAVATTTLALGVRSMKRHGVTVRNLDAVWYSWLCSNNLLRQDRYGYFEPYDSNSAFHRYEIYKHQGRHVRL